MRAIFFGVCCLLFLSASPTEAATSTTLVATSSVVAKATYESEVQSYFADIPVMIAIARCESRFRQFTDAGNVFFGGAGQEYIGIFQFARAIHELPAKALGYDLATTDGNLKYARHLYEQSGTVPWQSCVPANQSPAPDSTTEQRIILMKQLINLLQQLLKLKLAAE
ncbi:MAG: hypothetical protein RLZZ70_191 [Candidatus Parcubacteria bacterium]|jgi:hypothetical protein